MNQDITLEKEGRPLSFIRPLVTKIKLKFQKGDILSSLKKLGITTVSILLFLGLWHMGSKALYNKEAAFKIEKAFSEQGQAAADAERACIASGDSSCQPNTLPSPTQVWSSFQSLIEDHKMIGEKKAAFVEKMSKMNAKLVAQGKNAIVYTGRASFVDIILTSIKTVFAGFFTGTFNCRTYWGDHRFESVSAKCL